MKKSKRLLCGLLAAVMLAACFCGAAFAAGERPLALQGPSSVNAGGTVEILVDAQQAGVVTDGKLTVAYPAAALRYQGASVGDAWQDAAKVVLSDNAETTGKVILAFAGETAAQQGAIIKLKFAAIAEASAIVSIVTDGDDTSWLTGLEGADLSAQTTVEVHARPVWPETPTGPTLPSDPARPADTACPGGADCPAAAFTDLDYTGENHEAVDYMVKKGYMNGVSSTRFAPNDTMDRAMMVTILYRMSGSPAVTGDMPFEDVASDAYYYSAVMWAAQEGVTQGTSYTTFSPYDAVTREQLVAFLYRYASHIGRDVSARAELSGYADTSAISGYAVEPMQWAVGSGLVNGVSDTQLDPLSDTIRLQIALLVWRFDTAKAQA